MIVRPYEPGDLEKLKLQEAQAGALSYFDDEDIMALAAEGHVLTGALGDEVIGIAGLSPQWPGRAVAWALLSVKAKDHFLTIHRAVLKHFIRSGYRRIEATVDPGFEQGHRWVKMLGFEIEGYMKAYRPDGGDQILYARVRR